MVSRVILGIATALTGALLLLTVVSCEASTEPAEPPAHYPPPPPTPTDQEREVQTPTDFGNNTRVVDGDIHVWYVPTCPPVPPATWVASIILTDLRSGSHLYLDRDGSVRTSPEPDYRSEEGRERFAEVLADASLMQLILTFPKCP